MSEGDREIFSFFIHCSYDFVFASLLLTGYLYDNCLSFYLVLFLQLRTCRSLGKVSMKEGTAHILLLIVIKT